jgi:hypothetical protein
MLRKNNPVIIYVKGIITTVTLLLSISVFGQFDNEYDTTDSLKTVPLDYEVIDSTAVRHLLKYTENIRRNWFNILEPKRKLIYYTNNKNQWTLVSLPFESAYWSVSDLEEINIDRKGKPEIILKGYYQVDYQISVLWLKILKIDSAPTQVFNIFYGCQQTYSETIRLTDSIEGDMIVHPPAHEELLYMRDISISENGIIISPDPLEDGGEPLPDVCRLTKIPSGKYILKDGRIQKRK